MPDTDIKRINDPEQLRQIAERVFTKLPVQLQDKTGIFPVSVQGTEDDTLLIIHNQPEAPSRLLVLTHNDNKMFLECRVHLRHDDGKELVKPVRLHLKKLVRRQKRMQLPKGDNRVAWITEVVPMKSIPESLSAYNNNRDMLLKAYQEQLRIFFTDAEIVFRKTFRMDMRMRIMSNLQKSIFVPTRMNPNLIDGTRFASYEDYKKIIQYDHLPDNIISEITEPLTYKNLYMFGYMKILSDRELTLEDVEKVQEISRDFETEILNQELLPRNLERSVVVDITTGGVGFMHPHNPAIIRNFMPGEHIVFDIHLPNGKILSVSGLIRNMKSLEKAHRIGIEFENLTMEQKAELIMYIDGINNHKNNAGNDTSSEADNGDAQ